MIDVPQIILKAIKAQTYDVAIDLITFFNREMLPKLREVPFALCLKEEIDKLAEVLKDKLKEAVNFRVDSKETLKHSSVSTNYDHSNPSMITPWWSLKSICDCETLEPLSFSTKLSSPWSTSCQPI
jgi:hypothetical protein